MFPPILPHTKKVTDFKTEGAIHSTKISGNFGSKFNGSVRSNRKSFEKTGPFFDVDHFSRSDRSEFWLNGSRPESPLTVLREFSQVNAPTDHVVSIPWCHQLCYGGRRCDVMSPPKYILQDWSLKICVLCRRKQVPFIPQQLAVRKGQLKPRERPWQRICISNTTSIVSEFVFSPVFAHKIPPHSSH